MSVWLKIQDVYCSKHNICSRTILQIKVYTTGKDKDHSHQAKTLPLVDRG